MLFPCLNKQHCPRLEWNVGSVKETFASDWRVKGEISTMGDQETKTSKTAEVGNPFFMAASVARLGAACGLDGGKIDNI